MEIQFSVWWHSYLWIDFGGISYFSFLLCSFFCFLDCGKSESIYLQYKSKKHSSTVHTWSQWKTTNDFRNRETNTQFSWNISHFVEFFLLAWKKQNSREKIWLICSSYEIGKLKIEAKTVGGILNQIKLTDEMLLHMFSVQRGSLKNLYFKTFEVLLQFKACDLCKWLFIVVVSS